MRALRVYVGPVQPFIAAGRRTRDFWAGSFLLSRLAGEAMVEVERQGGTITVPKVDGEPTLEAIKKAQGNSATCVGPPVGTLVNHFRATVPDGFDPNRLRISIAAVFSRIAQAVWDTFLESVVLELAPEKQVEIRDRWCRQTTGRFFEVLWVLGPDDIDWSLESRWLERRKITRTHLPIIDPLPGDRCPVHPDLTEISGFARLHQREEQNKFWEAVRTKVCTSVYGEGGKYFNTLEIREGERLCAMALVKRLFPVLKADKLSECIGWVPYHRYASAHDDEANEAQKTLRNWSSTAFIAAVPWIATVGKGDPDAARTYGDVQFKTLGGDRIHEAERPQHHRIASVERLLENTQLTRFATLDGPLHFERGIEGKRLNSDQGNDLLREFKDFREKMTIKGGPSDRKASPFYALLDMDGDSMGKVFSTSKMLAEKASYALLEFAAGVPKIIRDHDGALIYAGADDVNAMLPIETAIPCAQILRRHWTETMDKVEWDNVDAPTLSGSIVFADYQNALDDVRRLAHERLDTVAKNQTGRDAMALAVMKSGGVTAAWASCWDAPEEADEPPLAAIMKLAERSKADKMLAARLPYLLRQRFGLVLGTKADTGCDLFNDEEITKFLVKEIRDGGYAEHSEATSSRAALVVNALRPYRRVEGRSIPAPRHIGGLLIARFLGDESIWNYVELRKEGSMG